MENKSGQKQIMLSKSQVERFVTGMRKQPYVKDIAFYDGSNPPRIRLNVADGPFFFQYWLSLEIDFPQKASEIDAFTRMVDGYLMNAAFPILKPRFNVFSNSKFANMATYFFFSARNFSFHMAAVYSAVVLVIALYLFMQGVQGGFPGATSMDKMLSLAWLFALWGAGVFIAITGGLHQAMFVERMRKDIARIIDSTVKSDAGGGAKKKGG